MPSASLPSVWEQIDSWMRPKILDATPSEIKDWVTQRTGQGCVDDSHVVLYYLMKTFAPGQYFQAGMLKEKQGILDGVDNRFMRIIMTESGLMSTRK